MVALAAAGALAVTGCSSSKSDNGGSSSSKKAGGGLGGGNSGGNPANQTYKVGFIGALSGDNAQLGINERNGAQIAVDEANASGKYKFKVTLVPADSEGDPAKAPSAAQALISASPIVATAPPRASPPPPPPAPRRGPASAGEGAPGPPPSPPPPPPMPIVTASA